MAKALSELLKTVKIEGMEHQAPSTHQFDYPFILTEEERDIVLHNAKQDFRRKFIKRMRLQGFSDEAAKEESENVDFTKGIHTEAILAQANMFKYFQLEDQAQRKREFEKKFKEREALIAEWTAVRYRLQIHRFFMANYGRFDYDETNRLLVAAICYMFSNDPRFESELKFSRKKGLWVTGTAGLGKTKHFMAISENPIYPIHIYNLIDIADTVKEKGEFNIKTEQINMLDDIGSEAPEVNHYGTKINWVKQFIESYYLKHTNDYGGLIVTTNLSGEDIEARYGYRVRSRVREMFNVIRLTGEDKRK